MIAIVDYRAGNLASVALAVGALGFTGRITSSPQDIADADHVIFPGVGAAGSAMKNLLEMGLREPLNQAVASGKPFLGICLGYQVLFERSEEDGGVDLLNFLEGQVIRFPDTLTDEENGRPLKIPQMGWNEAVPCREHAVWADVPPGSEFYFVHSYHPVPAQGDVCATTSYGIEFASGVAKDNLIAFQFHPEKSGRPGLKILENFCRWVP